MSIHQRIPCGIMGSALVWVLTTSAPMEGQVVKRSPSVVALVGVEYVDQPYEVRIGGAMAIPLLGPLDLYPSVFRYIDPNAEYDEMWQLELNARVRLIEQPRGMLPYLGAGMALQALFVPLSGPNPDKWFLGNVFTVLLAGLEFRPSANVRPVVEAHMLGTGAHRRGPSGSGWNWGEFAVLAGLSIRLDSSRP